ncbi:MAG: hypothetical protein J5I92_06020 [Thiogranum sp.]|nr:hypothetical protein [Thiogranum sp.]
MMKLIKSDAAIIAILTLLLFVFVKFQDVSAATAGDGQQASPTAAAAFPAAARGTQR